MRATSVCFVRPLAATMASHSRMGLPYVASMLRIWAWSPSSTVAIGAVILCGSGEAQGAFGRVGGQTERALVGLPGLGRVAEFAQQGGAGGTVQVLTSSPPGGAEI